MSKTVKTNKFVALPKTKAWQSRSRRDLVERQNEAEALSEAYGLPGEGFGPGFENPDEPARSPGFYIMNDSTEWHLDPAPKGSPVGMKVLRVLCGGKQVLRRVLDEHDRQALGKMLLEGKS